jgi:hypothetical protein
MLLHQVAAVDKFIAFVVLYASHHVQLELLHEKLI